MSLAVGEALSPIKPNHLTSKINDFRHSFRLYFSDQCPTAIRCAAQFRAYAVIVEI